MPLRLFAVAVTLTSFAAFAEVTPKPRKSALAPKAKPAASPKYGPKNCKPYKLPASLARYTVPATAAEAAPIVKGERAGIAALGKGKVCSGEVFKVSKPGLTLWRVANKAANTQERMGAWWSFTQSDTQYKTRAAWRKDNAVCKDWNPAADGIFSCSLAVGELILAGPGQSANCDDQSINKNGKDKTHYQPSSTVQVFWNGWRSSSPSCAPSKDVKWKAGEDVGSTPSPAKPNGSRAPPKANVAKSGAQ